MSAYLPALTTIVGALIALAGVALTAHATDRRDRRNRIWDRRAELLVDCIRFLNGLRRKAPIHNGDPGFDAWSLQIDELGARLAVFGDKELVDAFFAASKPVHRRPPDPEHPESAWSYAPILPFEELAQDRLGLTSQRRSRLRRLGSIFDRFAAKPYYNDNRLRTRMARGTYAWRHPRKSKEAARRWEERNAPTAYFQDPPEGPTEYYGGSRT